MKVQLIQTTSKKFSELVNQIGTFIFDGNVVYFEIEKGLGVKTSCVEDISVDDEVIAVNTLNSFYEFKKIKEE